MKKQATLFELPPRVIKHRAPRRTRCTACGLMCRVKCSECGFPMDNEDCDCQMTETLCCICWDESGSREAIINKEALHRGMTPDMSDPPQKLIKEKSSVYYTQ